jgi:hypothetical protein
MLRPLDYVNPRVTRKPMSEVTEWVLILGIAAGLVMGAMWFGLSVFVMVSRGQ